MAARRALLGAAPLLALLAWAGCGGEEGADAGAPGTPLLSEGTELDLISVSEAVWAREEEVGAQGLTPAERVFLYIWNLEAEVNNGGFEQFYYNSSGDHALETPAALRQIGANRVAALVEEANNVFGPPGPPRDPDDRISALERLGDARFEAFGALDDTFYAYPDDLAALLRRFVEGNREQFHRPR